MLLVPLRAARDAEKAKLAAEKKAKAEALADYKAEIRAARDAEKAEAEKKDPAEN